MRMKWYAEILLVMVLAIIIVVAGVYFSGVGNCCDLTK